MRYWIISVFIVVLCLAQGANAEPIEKIVFIRVDDLYTLNTDVFPQEIDEFLAIAEKFDARVVLSTIPARLRQRTNKNGIMSEQILDYARRGHQIAQHGYDHRCPFTGSTSHEFYTPDIEGYSREERLAKILEGKKLLESVIGKKVVSYVGPGSDSLYVPEDELPAFYEMGFINIPSADFDEEGRPKSIGLRMRAVDHGWHLTPENYEQRLEDAKRRFLEEIETSTEWSLQFHDYFTRAAYGDGIVLRWFEEIMTWLHGLEEYRIKHPTFEQYYRQFHPEFSSELNEEF
jgi:peptidoglycan/xylan/chitin deacetylase (PgdA/CDA1 family)